MTSPTASTLGLKQRTSQDSHRDSPRLTFRPDIEGLRAIAILLVVLGHAGVPFLTGGYIGVDVFFVISGFLITSLLLAEINRTGSISIRRFYARRATRLLPAATLVIVCTILASWLWLPATRFKSIVVDAIASAFYGINYRLAVQGTEYLTTDEPPSPLQHFWSLAVEEQFYIIWPLLLLGLLWTWRNRSWRQRRTLVASALVLLAGFSLSLSITQTATSAPWAYFGIHTRAWELAFGALIAVFAASFGRLPRASAAAMSWCGIAAILASAAFFDSATEFPGALALLPVFGTGLVLVAGCSPAHTDVRTVLGAQPFQIIGKLSYGWYLWHWPIFMIAPTALGFDASLTVNLGLAVAALILAGICYELIENPVRSIGMLKAKPWRGVALGVSLTAITAVFAVLAALFTPATAGTGTAPDVAEQFADGDISEHELAELLKDGSEIENAPSNLKPSLDVVSDDLPVTYADGCHLDYEKITPEGACVYGAPEGTKTIVLFGDSHAAQWFPALVEIADTNGWRLVSFTKSACPVPMITTFISELNREYDECSQWRNETLESIKDMHPQIVVMSTSDDKSPLGADDENQTWTEGMLSSFEAVASDETELFFIADTPKFDQKVPDCVAGHLTDISQCNQAPADITRKPERRQLVIEALQQANVTVIDPLPWICTPQACPPIVGNLLVFRDSHHITTVYSEFLSPVLARCLGLN